MRTAFLGAFDKVAKAEVNARLKEIRATRRRGRGGRARRWLELSEAETALKRAVKEQDAALDKLAYEKYPTLTDAEIKSLVIDDKWMARLSAAVQGELDRVSQTLTGRIRELAERYAHAAAAARRRGGRARCARGGAPREDGGVVEVRPGYKQTEVGVIPEDWQSVCLQA